MANRPRATPPGSLCEGCAEAVATEWHPDQDGDVYGYCAPCVAAMLADPPTADELAEGERDRG